MPSVKLPEFTFCEIENDAQTAALKNLLFRSLIYHVYIDAGINSRLTVLKHMKDRVAGYKEFFGPYVSDHLGQCASWGTAVVLGVRCG